MPLHLRTLLRHRAVCCALSKVLWQMHKDLRYNRKFKERRRYNNTLHHIYHTPSTPHSNSVLQKPTIFSHTHTQFSHSVLPNCICTPLYKLKLLPNSAKLATNQTEENMKSEKGKSSDSFREPKSCCVSVHQHDSEI